MSIANFILQASIWSILLPLTVGSIYFKQLDRPSQIIFIVVVVATIPQLLTVLWMDTSQLNVVYNIYTVLEFLLIYFFIGRNFQDKIFNRISKGTVGLFFLFFTWAIGKNGLNNFLTGPLCAANCIYLIWIAFFILEGLLNEEKLLNPQLPLFWFIVGILFYTACTFFVIALTRYIKSSSHPVIQKMWSVQGVFNTMMYLFFAIGFYKSHLLLQIKRTPQ